LGEQTDVLPMPILPALDELAAPTVTTTA